MAWTPYTGHLPRKHRRKGGSPNRFSDRGDVKGMVLLSAGVLVLSEVRQCRFMMA
ncbi:hypothetical protein SAMN05421772_1081, partial [Paracoccus saliphilus]